MSPLVTRCFITLGAALAACSSDPPGEGKTYVLVHGAWMGEAGWDPVAARLRAQGATVHTLELPAHGDDSTPPGSVTLASYVDRVSATIDAAGAPVILAGHSMAGLVISQAAEQRPADIARLVYIAAYVPRTGESLQGLATMDADSQIGAHLQFHEDGTVDIAAAAFPDLFCADCEGGARTALLAGYRAEPVAPFGTPVTLTAAFDGVAKTYVHTQQDRVISPALQDQMVAATPMDRTSSLDNSHVPLLSAPDAVASALLAE